jgi:hypothetical protein
LSFDTGRSVLRCGLGRNRVVSCAATWRQFEMPAVLISRRMWTDSLHLQQPDNFPPNEANFLLQGNSELSSEVMMAQYFKGGKGNT